MRHPRRGITALLVLLLTAALSAQSAVVERVIDGDTVVVSGIGTVRLIGVDTPETVDPRQPVQYVGTEASAFTTGLLLGQTVRVEYDGQRTDRYHRTLAYLYLPDGRLANLDIVRLGYGHAYLSFPFSKMAAFQAAEREARSAGRGLWATAKRQAAPPSTTAAGSVRVWVNTASRVYHCAGTRYFGNTKAGVFMTQDDATASGNRPANGRMCQ